MRTSFVPALVALTLLAGAAGANEEAPAEPKSSRPWPAPHHGRRWSLVASAAYATALGDVGGLEIEPSGPGLGLRAAYTLPVGIWFGAYGEFYFGESISQVYAPPLSTITEALTADTHASYLGANVGYEQALGPVALRYLLGVGVTLLDWDLGAIPYDSLAGFSPMVGSSVSLHLEAGFGLVLPLGWLELGAEAFYRIDFGTQAPNVAGGRLVFGGRL